MQTILHDRHIMLGAKMAPFAGWDMPIQYKGVLAEHLAVRERAGVFDVSHMGCIAIQGPNAEQLLEFLSTNHISGKEPGTAIYTVWSDEKGGTVDDIMVYKNGDNDFFVIGNASNRQKDLAHLKEWSQGKNVKIQDYFEGYGILALQGPQAINILSKIYPEAVFIKPMHFIKRGELYISRTGYTGAGGFEFYAPNEEIVRLWDTLMQMEVEPVGLGARDTLRLEMGFALYGHELSAEISACESVSAWTIKWDKPDFLGKNALQKEGRHPYGIVLLDRGIAREGNPVFKDETQIGVVTSGSFSPTLNKAIALILVDQTLQIGDIINIQIRQTTCQAQVVELPFVRKNK